MNPKTWAITVPSSASSVISPRHPVRVGPNDPTVAVGDGRRSTDVVNPIDRHRDQILARSLVDRCDQALERAVEQHRMKVIALCVNTFGQRQTGEHLTRGAAQRADGLKLRTVTQAAFGE